MYVCKCTVYVCAFVRILLGSCKDIVLHLRSIPGSVHPPNTWNNFLPRKKQQIELETVRIENNSDKQTQFIWGYTTVMIHTDSSQPGS